MSGQIITEEQKEFARNLMRQIPFVQLLGIELIDLAPGEAEISLKIEEKHLRGGRFLHGGVTASLIDTVTAFAVGTITQSPANAVTVDLTIHYLRPIYQGEIKARARVVRAGNRLLTVSADVFDADGELVATALSTYSKITPNR
jgi:uncharacterized protein (TIGR00369 family)